MRSSPASPSWSAGSPIRTTDGVLRPLGIIPEAGEFVLRATLTTIEGSEKMGRSLLGRRIPALPRMSLGDLTIIDSRGSTYQHHRVRSSGSATCGRGPAHVERANLDIVLEPPPDPDAEWVELRGSGGPATRLLRGIQTIAEVAGPTPVNARNGQREVEALCRRLVGMHLSGLIFEARFFVNRCDAAMAQVTELERSCLVVPEDIRSGLAALCRHLVDSTDFHTVPLPWRHMLEVSDKGDGQRRNADLGIVLPPVEGVIVTFGTIGFQHDSWYVYAEVTPGWWGIDPEEPMKVAVVGIDAQDDVGGVYVGTFDGSRSPVRAEGGEVVRQRLRPRLDPAAKVLRIFVRGKSEELVVDVPLPPAG